MIFLEYIMSLFVDTSEASAEMIVFCGVILTLYIILVALMVGAVMQKLFEKVWPYGR